MDDSAEDSAPALLGWAAVLDESAEDSAPALLGWAALLEAEESAEDSAPALPIGWAALLEADESAEEPAPAVPEESAPALPEEQAAQACQLARRIDYLGHGCGGFLDRAGAGTRSAGVKLIRALIASTCRRAMAVLRPQLAHPQPDEPSGADAELARPQPDEPAALALAQRTVTPMGLAIEQAAFAVKHGMLDSDKPERHDMVRQWFENVVASVSSKTAEADRSGVPPAIMIKYKHASAVAAWCLYARDASRMLGTLLDEVEHNGGELLLWSEFLSADETSLPLKVFDTEECSSSSLATGVARNLANPSVSISLKTSQTAITKILQSARSYACLFKVGSDFIHIEMEIPVPLQAMCSTMGDVYLKCFRESAWPLSHISGRFLRKQRLAITDADPAVALGLRALESETGITNWAWKCDIHKLQNAIKDVLAPVDKDTVAPLICLQLSLQSANCMKRFRECLRHLLSQRLVIHRCKPNQAHLNRTRAILNLYVPPTSNTNRFKRAIVLSVLNGDWRKETVQHYCQGCCASREACISKLVSFVTSVFAGVAPKTWPRSRWTGARESINWCLLLASCHSLLKDTYLLWAKNMRGGKWLARHVAGGGDVPAEHAEDAESLGRDAPGDDAMGDDAAEAGFPMGDQAAVGQAPSVPSTWEERQNEQSEYRRRASAWLLRAQVLPEMLLVRMVLSPLALAMDAYLSQAGEAWDRKQARIAAAARRQGQQEGGGSDHHGALRVMLLLEGELLRPAVEELRDIATNVSRWAVLPPSYMTAAFRTRVAARLGHCGSKLHSLSSDHTNYPIKLWRLLDDDSGEFAAALEAESECRFCRWSLSVVQHYKEHGGLQNPSLRAELWHTGLLQHFDNAAREAAHASIRRSIVAASVQTHAEKFQFANAEWLLRTIRRVVHKVGRRRRQPRQATGSQSEQPAQRRGGAGGAWRAFVRQESLRSQGRPDFGLLASKYRQLSGDTLAALKSRGREATASAKGSGSAFGLTTRGHERASRKRAFDEAVRNSLVDSAMAVPTEPGASEALETQIVTATFARELQSPWARLQHLKCRLREERAVELARGRALDEHFEQFTAVEGQEDIAGVSLALRGQTFELRRADFAMRPGPVSTHKALHWRPVSVLERVQHALRLRTVSVAGRVFFQSMAFLWDHLCRTVQFEQEPEIKKVPAALFKRPCHEAGMCVCSPRGLLLQRLSMNIDRVSKAAFGMGKRHRAKLGEAHVAYAFVGQTREQFEADSDSQPAAITSTKWYHVSEHSYSPWQSVYHDLQCNASARSPAEAPHPHVEATITLQFYRKFFMLDTFDLELRWCMVIYTTHLVERLLPEFLPNCMDLVLLHKEAKFEEVWNPWKKRGRKPHVAQEAPSGWLALLNAQGTEGAEGEDEDDDEAAESDNEMCEASDDEGCVDAQLGAAGGCPCPSDEPEVDSDCASSQGSEASSHTSAGSVLSLLAGVAGNQPEEEGRLDDPGAIVQPPGGPGPPLVAEPEAPLPGAVGLEVPRVPADIVLAVTEGPKPSTLVWYRSGTFYAYCRHHENVIRCCKSRQGAASKKASGGRPLGFLYWWLLQGLTAASDDAHKTDVYPSHGQRRLARDALKLVHGSEALFARERPKREDESDSEPEGLP